MSSAVEEMSELEALAKPVSAYIKRNFDPMTKIIISDERVDVCQGVMGLSFEDGTNFVNKQNNNEPFKYNRGSLLSTCTNHVKMWLWIADETCRREKKVEKADYFKAMGIDDKQIKKQCFYCDYADYRCRPYNLEWAGCLFCPIDDINGKPPCKGLTSPYIQYHLISSHNYHRAADLAKQVAELKLKDEYEVMLKAEEKELNLT